MNACYDRACPVARSGHTVTGTDRALRHATAGTHLIDSRLFPSTTRCIRYPAHSTVEEHRKVYSCTLKERSHSQDTYKTPPRTENGAGQFLGQGAPVSQKHKVWPASATPVEACILSCPLSLKRRLCMYVDSSWPHYS